LLTFIKALPLLIPYWRPSDSHIAAIADAHCNTALASLNILPDFKSKVYIEDDGT
jgi:hypothetical protein